MRIFCLPETRMTKSNELYLCLLDNLMRKIAIFFIYNDLPLFIHYWIPSFVNDTREWLKSGKKKEEGLCVDLATLKAPLWNTGITVSKNYFEIPPHGNADNRLLLSLMARKWVIEWNEWDEKLGRVRVHFLLEKSLLHACTMTE